MKNVVLELASSLVTGISNYRTGEMKDEFRCVLP